MKSEQIRKAAEEMYARRILNARGETKAFLQGEAVGFIDGAEWVLAHLCGLPWNEAVGELAGYAGELDSRKERRRA